SELPSDIVHTLHPFRRDMRLEEIGNPPDLRLPVRPLRQRTLQPSFAQIAPRANHVRNDIDGHGHAHFNLLERTNALLPVRWPRPRSAANDRRRATLRLPPGGRPLPHGDAVPATGPRSQLT